MRRSGMWSLPDLLSTSAAALAATSCRLDAEHAVRGLDGLSEVQMHPLIAEAFERAGLGVLREQGYPGLPEARPADRDRERCDLVLLPAPGLTLADPLRRVREQDRAAGTLFEAVEEAREDDPHEVPVGDAFWLEIKVVGQFVIVDGYAQPNRTWSSELVNAIAKDVSKLARDEHIERGALLLVLFTRDDLIADHDLTLALHRCLDRNVPLGAPEREAFDIPDRIGNTRCHLALIPARP